MGIREGVLGNRGHREAVREHKRPDAAVLEHAAPQRSNGRGNDHTLQHFRVFEGILFNGMESGIGSEGHGGQRGVCKRVASDEDDFGRDLN